MGGIAQVVDNIGQLCVGDRWSQVVDNIGDEGRVDMPLRVRGYFRFRQTFNLDGTLRLFDGLMGFYWSVSFKS